jgi:hypothetical protein
MPDTGRSPPAGSVTMGALVGAATSRIEKSDGMAASARRNVVQLHSRPEADIRAPKLTAEKQSFEVRCYRMTCEQARRRRASPLRA